jgi:hypothetical protein
VRRAGTPRTRWRSLERSLSNQNFSIETESNFECLISNLATEYLSQFELRAEVWNSVLPSYIGGEYAVPKFYAVPKLRQPSSN